MNYLLWTEVLEIIEKVPGKTHLLQTRRKSPSEIFLRQENSIFGAWKSWTIYTPTNTTAKNGIFI